MAKLSAVEAARLRMALVDEAKLLQTGAMNTDPNIGAAYPRMLYRATEQEDVHVISYDKFGLPAEKVTVNSFGGLLCDTIIAETADEAEALLAQGWEVSPSAAYGEQSPAAKAATAKDDEIAALRAELETMRAVASKPEQPAEPEQRRGPGRPRSAPQPIEA